MPPQLWYDYDQFNYDKPVITLDDIRRVNPQRHEMEQLTGIVWVSDSADPIELVGFKDLGEEEFWIKGHMPGYPLMPGVLICESAAQLAGFYARKNDILKAGDYIGFGGMDAVPFRKPIYPPARLIIGVRSKRIKPKMRAEFEFQAVVENDLVAHGGLHGVPISRSQSVATQREST